MAYRFRFRSLSSVAALLAATIPQLVFAQRNHSYGGGIGEGGIFACCSGVAILVPIAFIALNIALLVWVNKDAKARGMETPVVWMLVVLLTSFIGLIVYLLSRPKGQLAPCPRCGGKKLPILAKCPHCGAAV